MSHDLRPGNLAVVNQGGGPNNVRAKPDTGAAVKGQIPENAVLAILAKPTNWRGTYPHNDGVYVWWYVRGRKEAKLAGGRFRVIQGWTAANKNGQSFLTRMDTGEGCLDTMGTALGTQLNVGQQAYVLASEGLNVRKEADPQGDQVGVLAQGAVVEVLGGPECNTKMVWWQVKPLNSPGPSGWASESSGLLSSIEEWFLVPLTLL